MQDNSRYTVDKCIEYAVGWEQDEKKKLFLSDIALYVDPEA